MTNTTQAIISILVRSANEFRSAAPGKATQLAKARLLGNAEILSALGWGMTPFAIEMAAFQAIDAIGTMPAATADNAPHKAWFAQVEANIAAALGIES